MRGSTRENRDPSGVVWPTRVQSLYALWLDRGFHMPFLFIWYIAAKHALARVIKPWRIFQMRVSFAVFAVFANCRTCRGHEARRARKTWWLGWSAGITWLLSGICAFPGQKHKAREISPRIKNARAMTGLCENIWGMRCVALFCFGAQLRRRGTRQTAVAYFRAFELEGPGEVGAFDS